MGAVVLSGETVSLTLKCFYHIGVGLGVGVGAKLLGSLTSFAWKLGSPAFSGFRVLRLAD